MSSLGLISKNNKNRAVAKYFRLLTFLEIISVLLYGFVFLVLLPDSREFVIDRIVTLFIASIAFACTFLNLDKKIIKNISFFSYYAFTAQIIFSTYTNGFNSYHFIGLLIAIQAISTSLGRIKYARGYLFFSASFSFICLYLDTHTGTIDKTVIAGALGTLVTLLYIVINVKSKFENRLKFKEEFLRTMVTVTEEAILITNFEGDIFETNNIALSMFGYTKKELSSQNFRLLRKIYLTKEEDDKGVNQLLENKFWNDEIELLRKDKSEFDAYVSISFIKKQDQEYLVYRVSDISIRKTNEIALIKAKEDAEAAAVAKSSFLATMSHEIRTPMNGVIGMTHILGKTKLNSVQQQYLETIEKSSGNLLAIINEVLDFSQAESGKMLVQSEPVDIHETVEDILELLGTMADEKGVSLQVKIETGTPQTIISDPTRIKQILVNLISNAIKFTNDGHVNLNVRLIKQEDPDVKLEFTVSDTGIGISKEKLSSIFDSFTQSDSSTTRKYGGTGLGLAICKKLVTLLNGDINVTSELGKGSEFQFTIRGEVDRQEEPVITISEPSMNDSEPLKDLSILVAEDDFINQEVAKLILSDLGGVTEIANNGREALDMCKEKHYDLIFMDVRMPEMDGLEATRQIRIAPLTFGSPYIIALTANAFEEDRKKCFDSGMDDFICKPIPLHKLKTAISKFNEQLTQPK